MLSDQLWRHLVDFDEGDLCLIGEVHGLLHKINVLVPGLGNSTWIGGGAGGSSPNNFMGAQPPPLPQHEDHH